MRSLAILSEGRLSEAQRRSLTLMSLGWLEPIFVGVADEEVEERKLGVVYAHNPTKKKDPRLTGSLLYGVVGRPSDFLRSFSSPFNS